MYDTPVDEIPESELGPAHDAEVERMVEAESSAGLLQQVHVTLDWIADTNDVSPDLIAAAREIQAEVEALRSDFEAEQIEAAHRVERLRDRLDAVRERDDE